MESLVYKLLPNNEVYHLWKISEGKLIKSVPINILIGSTLMEDINWVVDRDKLYYLDSVNSLLFVYKINSQYSLNLKIENIVKIGSIKDPSCFQIHEDNIFIGGFCSIKDKLLDLNGLIKIRTSDLQYGFSTLNLDLDKYYVHCIDFKNDELNLIIETVNTSGSELWVFEKKDKKWITKKWSNVWGSHIYSKIDKSSDYRVFSDQHFYHPEGSLTLRIIVQGPTKERKFSLTTFKKSYAYLFKNNLLILSGNTIRNYDLKKLIKDNGQFFPHEFKLIWDNEVIKVSSLSIVSKDKVIISFENDGYHKHVFVSVHRLIQSSEKFIEI